MRELPLKIVELIHYVDLNKAGWWEEFIRQTIVAILWEIKNPAPILQIRKRILQDFNVDIKSSEIKSELDLLVSEGKILNYPDNRYGLSIESKKNAEKSIIESRERESYAKSVFFQEIKKHEFEFDIDQIWEHFLSKFLIPLVETEGAKTYDLLIGGKKEIRYQSYIDNFLLQIDASIRENIRFVVFEFLTNDDVEIKKYLLTYLDAYFLISASGLPNKVIEEISHATKDGIEFNIYIDTNFLFSILGLHDNPSNQAANDLFDLAKTISKNIKINYIVCKSTLEETINSISFHKRRLIGGNYMPNIAEAAINLDISGVAKTYFQRIHESKKQITVDDYFSPYEENMIEIIDAKGIILCDDPIPGSGKICVDIHDDIKMQIQYEQKIYANQAKYEKQIEHDVRLWHFIQNLRGKKQVSPLDARNWIVTVDYRFIAFDKYNSERNKLLIACMHPSQLIQLMRFFVPRTDNFEKTLLGIMKFPIVNLAVNSESEQISLKILQHLSRHEGIEDLPVESLEKILTNNAIREKITKSKFDDNQANELINNALVGMVAEKDLIINNSNIEIEKLKHELEEIKLIIEKSSEENNQKEEISLPIKELEIPESSKGHEVKFNANVVNKYKALSAILLSLLTAFNIFLIPQLIEIPWLISHQNRYKLQFFTQIFFLGIIWIIFDNNKARRWFAFGTIIFGVLFSVIQII